MLLIFEVLEEDEERKVLTTSDRNSAKSDQQPVSYVGKDMNLLDARDTLISRQQSNIIGKLQTRRVGTAAGYALA